MSDLDPNDPLKKVLDAIKRAGDKKFIYDEKYAKPRREQIARYAFSRNPFGCLIVMLVILVAIAIYGQIVGWWDLMFLLVKFL